MSHEREHQTREARAAKENGEKIISSVVRIYTRQCPECHTMYAAGGETRILKGKDNSGEYAELMLSGLIGKGGYLSGNGKSEPSVNFSV